MSAIVWDFEPSRMGSIAGQRRVFQWLDPLSFACSPTHRSSPGLVLRAAAVLARCSDQGTARPGRPRVMQAAQRQGGSTPQRAPALVQLITEVAAQTRKSRLKGRQRVLNRSLLYRDDREIWGRSTTGPRRWSRSRKGRRTAKITPSPVFLRCRLRALPGVKMRLVYVRAPSWLAAFRRSWCLAHTRSPMPGAPDPGQP